MTKLKKPMPPAAPVTPSRDHLLQILATMPEEAFGWLVLTMIDRPMSTGRGQVWPDGLGGFSTASQLSIQDARRAARTLVGMP